MIKAAGFPDFISVTSSDLRVELWHHFDSVWSPLMYELYEMLVL